MGQQKAHSKHDITANFTAQKAAFKALRGGLKLRMVRDIDAITIVLIAVSFGLVLFGVVMVMSASSVNSYLADLGPWGEGFKHAGYALVALFMLGLAAFIKPEVYMRFALISFGGGLFLQALVFTPLGYEVWGNRNWLRLGPVQFQPSEFLKLALILVLGAMIQRITQTKRPVKAQIAPLIIFAGCALLLIVGGKDLGTASVLAMAVLGCMVFGEIDFRAIGIYILLILGLAALLVIASPNRVARILSFTGSSTDYSGLDWQPLHGIWALANGGLLGNGLGSSKAKWSWLPAAENDYIFAIIGEETGTVGCVAVIAAYAILCWAMLRVIARARNNFQKAVVGGIMVWIIGQAFTNIAVVLKIMPVLGVPLPLVSAGGTALISCCFALGVVISIANDSARFAAQNPVVSNRVEAR